jgi:hypothetical protein
MFSDATALVRRIGKSKTRLSIRLQPCGTELNIVQEGVPNVIPAEACYVGWQESLILPAWKKCSAVPDVTRPEKQSVLKHRQKFSVSPTIELGELERGQRFVTLYGSVAWQTV